MITELNIEGFKSIKKQKFYFKGITVLTGLNSTGKSSVVQSLLLLSHFNAQNILLQDYIKKFLQFSTIRNRYENAKEINLSLVEENSASSISIKRDMSSHTYQNLHDRYLIIDNKIEIILTSGFDYLFDESKDFTYIVRIK